MKKLNNFELAPEEFEALEKIIAFGINSPEVDHDEDKYEIMQYGGSAYSKAIEHFEATQKKQERW